MISFEVAEKLPAGLIEKISMASDENRTRIAEGMSTEVRQAIVAHLTELGATRHTTADRLGATPTGFIMDLANNFDQASTVMVDADGVSLRMRSPIIARAFRDITIVPLHGQFLTIPLNALAYGHRVGEFEVVGLVTQGEGKTKEDHRKDDIPVFLLVETVTQPQDPTLFPTADEINTAAALGAVREVKAIAAENRRS